MRYAVHAVRLFLSSMSVLGDGGCGLGVRLGIQDFGAIPCRSPTCNSAQPHVGHCWSAVLAVQVDPRSQSQGSSGGQYTENTFKQSLVWGLTGGAHSFSGCFCDRCATPMLGHVWRGRVMAAPSFVSCPSGLPCAGCRIDARKKSRNNGTLLAMLAVHSPYPWTH